MQAYTSHNIPERPLPPTQKDSSHENIDLADLLQADELRTIHQLIYELGQLSRQGIETLTINKADTFLEALVTAVQDIKNQA